MKGYGRRNSTLNAIAPTTSSAFILGQVSQGIEPIWSNIYVKDIAKIKTTIKNPFLMRWAGEKGKEHYRCMAFNTGIKTSFCTTFRLPNRRGKGCFKNVFRKLIKWILFIKLEIRQRICRPGTIFEYHCAS